MDGNFQGQMLRIERLKQGKELKEVVGNYCSVSTLSKIERGKQKAHPELLVDLYGQLGIKYSNDLDFVHKTKSLMDDYFYNRTYHFDHDIYEKLKEMDEKISYSPLSLTWLIIKAMEEGGEEDIEVLRSCEDLMTEEDYGWYSTIWDFKDKDNLVTRGISGHRILENSYGTINLMWIYWSLGQYNKAEKLSQIALNYALEEGNLFSISEIYIIRGGVFSSYNMEDSMINEYRKAINILKNTNWVHSLESIYYNMGATYLTNGNLEKSRYYLNKVDNKDFLRYHKMAILEIKSQNLEEAAFWIEKMEVNNEEYRKKYEKDSTWELSKKKNYLRGEDILKSVKYKYRNDDNELSDYIEILEKLMDGFNEDGKYGFMNFFKEDLLEAYKEKRRYKDAYELERLFSQLLEKHMIKD